MNKRIGTVFISHSSQEPDYSVTKSLAKALQNLGIDVWWDVERLEGGNFFPVEILEAIIRQKFFIFILSKRSVESKWCLRELIKATELEKDVIPLILERVPDNKSPLELSGLHWVEISSGILNSMPAILKAIGIGETSPRNVLDDPFARDGRLLEVIAEQLRYGKSFTDTLNLVKLLQNVGIKCAETDRAKEIFNNMTSLSLYRMSGGMKKIDYEKVRSYLLFEWKK